MFSTAPPGYPNTMSTPRSSSALTNISAPVIFMSFSLPDHGAGSRRAHQPGVPGQIPRPDLGRRGFPRFPRAAELGRRDVQRNLFSSQFSSPHHGAYKKPPFSNSSLIFGDVADARP